MAITATAKESRAKKGLCVRKAIGFQVTSKKIKKPKQLCTTHNLKSTHVSQAREVRAVAPLMEALILQPTIVGARLA